MSTIIFNCLIAGENPEDNVFVVEIDKHRSISFLRKTIKSELHPKLLNVCVTDIKLWKVNVPFNDKNEYYKAVKNFDKNSDISSIGGTYLRPISNINECFDQPGDKHIHIIVKLPCKCSNFHVFR